MTSLNDDADTDTPIETPLADEDDNIDQIVELTTQLQNKRALADATQNGQVLRGVHPKSHGCVRAEFSINHDIAEEHQVGLFAHPGKSYEAWIRFSNASVLREDDLKANREGKRENGSRGMAVKVMGVSGEMLDLDKGENNQDFLMINTPEFAFANVRDYLRLERILDQDQMGSDPTPYFFPAVLAGLRDPVDGEPAEITATRQFLKNAVATNPLLNNLSPADLKGTFDSAKVAQKIASPEHTVRNPLQVTYFGAAPFLFGTGQVMRFAAVPCENVPQGTFEDATDNDPSENYLREALTQSMKSNNDISFDFKIAVRSAGEEGLNIEDATMAWDNEIDEFVNVARITISAPQNVEDVTAIDQCEKLVFNPWHSLAAHQPLGGINRLRRNVYKASAENRCPVGQNETAAIGDRTN